MNLVAATKPDTVSAPLGLQTLRKPAGYLAALLILAVPVAFMPEYLQTVMTKFLIYALFAVSYDLIFGYTGLMSLGHAAFFGIGGYAVGLLSLHFDNHSFWLGLLLGIVGSMLAAALFGFISLRVSGVYFLLITFALGQLLYTLAWNVKWLNSDGMQGIAGIPEPDMGFPVTWNLATYYYLVLAIFAICYFFLYRLVNSPFGHVLVGIREGEARMSALGYNVYAYKYAAYIISGAFAGIAGVLFAYHNSMIAPIHFDVSNSFLPMAMAIIGSSGVLFGPVLGAAIVIFAEFFSSLAFPERWPLVLGGIFVLCILFARQGVAVYLMRLIRKVGKTWRQ